MIGNDIVDLHQAAIESNWQRKGWLPKLFSPQEIEYITQSNKPETLIWLYWSMKEAAYKAYNRMSNQSSFAPAKLCCAINYRNGSVARGHVSFRNTTYHTESSINDNYIHSVAKQHQDHSIKCLITIDSAGITLPADCTLKKDNHGLPYLINNATQKTSAASKSHHGRFQALIY